MKSLVIFIFLSSVAVAETIYVSQSGSGSGTGADASNRMSLTNINNASNWGVGAGKVSAGDTVSLGGTFTSQLIPRGNGTAGNVITILFESGSKFSAAYWPTGAIECSNLSPISYVTINGGTNGLIESTANGSALANQQDSYGVKASLGSNNFTIQNLRIENMYVRTPYTTEDLELGNPIYIPDIGDNVTVEGCYLTHGATLLNFSFTGGTRSNFIIRNNTFLYSNHTIGGGTTTNGAVLSGFEISGNTFDGFSQWRGQPGFHFDGIIFILESPASSEVISGLRIFNNTFGPDIGGPPIGGVPAHNTAAIFVDSYVAAQTPDTRIYNNLFLANPEESWSNGFINSNGLIFNNTMISGGGGTGIRCWDNTTIRNNVFYNVGNAISTNGITINIATVDTDYNVFYGLTPGNSFYVTPGAVDDAYEGTYSSLAQWQSFGFDTHSVAGQPLLDSNYVPTASDTLAKDQGVSMASFVTVDKRGVSRPQGPAWDKGAMEFESGGAPPPGIQTLNVQNLRIGP